MTAPAPPPLRWWGWGDRDTSIPAGLAVLLREELRIPVLPSDAGRPAMPALAPSALDADGLLGELRELCGAGAVRTDDETRVRHAGGRSYLDLLALRSGDIAAPDAVVSPTGAGAVAAVLRACARASCAVVPFGGGTSVVGGVRAIRGEHRGVIALDLHHLDQGVAVDPVSMTATLGAGMTGPQAEAFLAERGLTLGHFPQSFEYATIGGFAATRSAGQASSGYGRFDELVLGLRLVTPTGEIVVAGHPASAAGPSVRELVLGSEGRLGVITEVTVTVRRRPALPRYEAWSFAAFADGVAAMRDLVQGRVAPDVARLSDPDETKVGMAVAAHGGAVERIGRRYLRLRGHQRGCLLIAGWDSDALLTGAHKAEARAVLRRHHAIPLGAAPGRAWFRQRYRAPYLRDALLDAGVLVETLETATDWATLHRLHEAVTGALRTALHGEVTPLIGCHVSHVYPSGASLYFTVLTAAGPDPRALWTAAKRCACEAILENGGTITHHHAIGTDHRPYLDREIGPSAVAALRALARQVDPTAIMNPGKLLPD
ncbi:MAG: FAD-binding oxidoreductase [Candidatus Dormibacteraeota bacterium]|nr:FAD-binding oxidoreductase [Candidatus Dormibacteraeota bacterium]